MSAQGNGGPAFPTTDFFHADQRIPGSDGMTLRDYFAAHAPEAPEAWRGGDRKLCDVIDWRWWYADAMLKARTK